MKSTTTLVAALVAVMLTGWSLSTGSPVSTALTESACAAVGGTVGPDKICHAHRDNDGYTLDFRFAADYPDQRALTDFLMQRRDDFVDWALSMPNSYPGELDIIGHDYRSAGTQSLVLTIGTSAGVHPVTTYKAFNYDLAKHAPITFESLFQPDAHPLPALNPIIQPELDKHGATGSLTLDDLGATAYQNFAITDDSVIFFFDQDGLLPHENGPLTVEVPRTDLASLLA